jgi:hypothetical protein
MASPAIRVDINAALAGLQNVRANQIPYATSRALNDCADKAVDDLVAWVKGIFTFRGNSAWVRSRWFKSEKSNKKSLTAYVLGMFDYLLLHEEGGIKTPHRGATLAVPLGTLRYKRIPASLRPRYLLGNDLQGMLKSASLGPRSRKKQLAQFGKGFIVDLNGKRFIAMRTTQDIGIVASAKRLKGLRLLYYLTPAVRIVPRLRMHATVQTTVKREFERAFAFRMEQAMRTAR